jgi:hypothetical protein
MSNMYITEYASIGGNRSQISQEPAIAVQKVSFTGTPGLSAAFNNATVFVRVHVDGIASIKFGTAPTAAVTDPRLPADTTEYFAVPPAGAFKVSAITNT